MRERRSQVLTSSSGALSIKQIDHSEDHCGSELFSEEPPKTCLPLLVVIFLALARLEPSLARYPSTVITSPLRWGRSMIVSEVLRIRFHEGRVFGKVL